jgi:hypothetical protein
VGAVLGTCAFASFSLAINQVRIDGSDSWSVHYRGEMAVARRALADGQHALTAFASAGQVVDHLATALGVRHQTTPEGELIALTQASVEAARRAAASGDRTGAAKALQAAGGFAEATRSLARAFSDMDEITHLVALQHDDEDQPTSIRGVTLLRDGRGFWAFVQPNPASEQLYAAPMSGLDVRALLSALVALGADNAD